MSDIRMRHVWVDSKNWTKLKLAFDGLFSGKASFEECEVILFSSEEHKDDIEGKEIKLTYER